MPFRTLSASLNEGWKKFTKKRNDVVVKSDGCIYFTDPRTSPVAPEQWDLSFSGKSPRRESLMAAPPRRSSGRPKPEAEQRELQQLAKFVQDFGQQCLLTRQQRHAFRPARGDIGERQRLHEAAFRRRPHCVRPGQLS